MNLNGDVIIVGEDSSEEQRTAFKDKVKSTMSDTVDLVLGFLKCIALLVLCEFLFWLTARLFVCMLYSFNRWL